jgi:hypothetical protein
MEVLGEALRHGLHHLPKRDTVLTSVERGHHRPRQHATGFLIGNEPSAVGQFQAELPVGERDKHYNPGLVGRIRWSAARTNAPGSTGSPSGIAGISPTQRLNGDYGNLATALLSDFGDDVFQGRAVRGRKHPCEVVDISDWRGHHEAVCYRGPRLGLPVSKCREGQRD